MAEGVWGVGGYGGRIGRDRVVGRCEQVIDDVLVFKQKKAEKKVSRFDKKTRESDALSQTATGCHEILA